MKMLLYKGKLLSKLISLFYYIKGIYRPLPVCSQPLLRRVNKVGKGQGRERKNRLLMYDAP